MRLLCLSLVSVVVAGNVLSTWQDYYQAFGTVISGAFSHKPTLEEARKFANWQQVQHPTQFNLRYDCAPYKVGGDIARECRVDETVNCSITPVLVDREQDIMCFFDVHDNAVKGPLYFTGFDKLLDFLGPLKIHDSIYMHVDGKGSFLSVSDQVLTVAFRQEVFGSPNDKADPTIESTVKSGLAKLESKSVTLLKNEFFWTADSTKHYFTEEQHGSIDFGNEGAFAKDYSRFKSWHSILEPLIEHENRGDDQRDPDDHHTYDFYEYAYGENAYGDQNENIARDHDRHEDIQYGPEFCGLSNVIEQLKYRPGFIEIDLYSIAQGKDDKVKNACFAFLTLALTKQSSVHHMAINRKPEFLNFRGRSIQQIANPGSSAANQPYSMAGLLGDGQIIGIADSGVDMNSCYFYDSKGRVPVSTYDKATYDLSYRKVIQYAYIPGCGDTTDNNGGHGTHVAGIAAGCIANADITSTGQYDGMAPNAKIAFQDYASNGGGLCIPGMSQLYGNGYAAGARVHTNSWGSFFSGTGYYSTSESDGYLYKNPDMTIFFSAGNAGGNGNGISTIIMEASGKNMIAVGSSQTTLGSSNISYVAWYSSKGPVYDGRFKPDIVAPGDELNSAKASGSSTSQTCDTIQMTGTSMASPAAAGSALLVRQYFQDGTGRFWSGICNSGYRSCKPFTATGYLIKAVMIHSGTRMTQFAGGGQYNVQLGPPPDTIQGFGRVNLMNVLPLRNVIKGYDLFVADAVNIPENSNIGYTVKVVASGKPLIATISWYDPPSVQGTQTKALINDLDLLIVSPTGTNYYPNGRTFADSNNNNEKVVIASANAGSWKVSISSKSLPGGGNQLFALIITSAGSVVYS